MMSSLIFGMLLTAACGMTINNTNMSGEIHEMEYIGFADGVSFFYDSSTLRTWQDAKKYCYSFKKDIAIVNTEKQLELLTLADFYGSSNTYWTGGRDAQDLRQFSWERTNVAVPELLRTSRGLGNGMKGRYYSCIYLAKIKGFDYITFGFTECSSPMHTLCSS